MSSIGRRRFLTASALAVPAVGVASSSACAAKPAQITPGQVRTGADVLASRDFWDLAGHRLGIVTNPTGVLSSLDHLVDVMHAGGRGEDGLPAQPARTPRQ